MATPLQVKTRMTDSDQPRTLIGAKKVDVALITFRDENNVQQTQLAVVGENTVHLLESRSLGMSKNTTRQGTASEWLAKAVIEALKEK